MISIGKIIDNNFLKNDISITGLSDDFFAVYLYNLLINKDDNILVVMPSLYEANLIYNSIQNYTDRVLLFPMDDFLTSEALSMSPDLMITRLETLNELGNKKIKNIIVTHLEGYVHFLPTVDEYEKSILELKVGQEIDQKNLIDKLYYLGYHKETLVTSTGEFGIRGFIIDVFAIGEERPWRIEFFGDEVESIRVFDEENQRTINEVDNIIIRPFSDVLCLNENARKSKFYFEKSSSSLFDYCNDPIVVFKNYKQLCALFTKIKKESIDYNKERDKEFKGDYFLNIEDINVTKKIDYLNINNYSTKNLINYGVKELEDFNENISQINEFIKKNKDKVITFCLNSNQIKKISKLLDYTSIETDFDHLHIDEVNLVDASLSSGFVYKNYIFISQKNIFKIANNHKNYRTKFKYASKIHDINKINIGDYIVHDVHGIGIYNGIKVLKQNGIEKDYIELLYQGTDKLYIPVEKIDYISKFSGKEGIRPKVSKLGGTDWQKTKARVRNRVRDIAKSLINLYAKRQMEKGFSFAKDDELQLIFENQFEYKLTPDQELVIRQIKQDMESSHPMDRLLCGDVGYGKTEVAFRAIFKAIANSKQVLYLCPTTILSNQHYENALSRFRDFPVNIGLLNRFTSAKEKKRILEELESGKIDLVIGTHRLLGDDVKPKNLGLLVIDEEQRFGVVHKEKIKKYKTNVDVLTLTATPIPRTLQMSMVGIRSLSLIETPPMNRFPVQTYVIEESMNIIKDAIYKELSRGGQVFYLYNKVETIENEVLRLKNAIPEARIDFVHGQLSKNEIEDKMFNFINHEADVLVCTTIIETGLDISNANTLIVIDADRFGLSQLYQIRGRVGRSDKIAYAYLMYDGKKILKETAQKRLDVIKNFTELGSGFAIATRDLSIRGAGDILGSEQAGFIDSVGIELYLKILNEEVERLKGNIVPDEEEKNDKALLNVQTHISDEYVYDDDLKIEIHKLINSIDSLDAFTKVKQEIEDRFGKVDENVIFYMYEEWFEKLCDKYHVEKINQTKNFVEMIFSEEITKNIDIEKLFVDSINISNMFRFKTLGNKLVIILDLIKIEDNYIKLLIDILNTLSYLD